MKMNIATFNCRGLRNPRKRNYIYDIIMLQETNLLNEDLVQAQTA